MKPALTLIVAGLMLSSCHGNVHAAAPVPTGDDDSTRLQIYINDGGGDLGGNTYSYSRSLTGPLNLSNGTLKYTGADEPAVLDSKSDLEKVTITGGTHLRFSDNSSGIIIRNSTITAINATGLVSNLTIVGNFFPGSTTEFTGIFFNDVGNNVVITDNTFGPIHEPIHIIGGTASGFVCSYNEIVQAQRHGIELQFQAQGAVIRGNWLHNWRKNPGDDKANQPLDVDWSQNQGIEFMGNNGTVSNNWVRNAGFNAYTWTNGFTSKNNIWNGILHNPAWNGEPGGPAVAPTVVGDQTFALDAANCPPAPKAGPRKGK
jgi:hypothetical protein